MTIGVLIFTNKAKERNYNKKDIYDNKKNFGLNKILSQLNYEYEYCSTVNMNKYKHIIVSITSYYDILNLVKNISKERNSKIHIGGPGVNNIRGFLPFIDTAWFGRCDHGEINGIINGDNYKSLWRKKDDQKFEGIYYVSKPTLDGLGYEGEEETSVGCRQKCKFCHYSWWNGYIEDDEKSYKSGFTSYEDFFQAIKWERGRVITALDGMTEETRKRISKPISYEKIKEKILETNKIINRDKNITAKIYSVIGYPWESRNELEKCDIAKVLKEIEGKINNKLLFYFHLSHFIPMQKTPLWYVKFNWSNYRKEAKKKPMLYSTDKIKLYTGTATTSPSSAAEQTIIQRSSNNDHEIIRLLATNKWQAQASVKKEHILRNELPRFFTEQKKETISNIITPWSNYNKQYTSNKSEWWSKERGY